jgi:hypothetical protein
VAVGLAGLAKSVLILFLGRVRDVFGTFWAQPKMYRKHPAQSNPRHPLTFAIPSQPLATTPLLRRQGSRYCVVNPLLELMTGIEWHRFIVRVKRLAVLKDTVDN